MPKLTSSDIRNKFREETGKKAILKTIKESVYLSGYPKKVQIESYNPLYTKWLEDFLIKNSE